MLIHDLHIIIHDLHVICVNKWSRLPYVIFQPLCTVVVPSTKKTKPTQMHSVEIQYDFVTDLKHGLICDNDVSY